MPPVACILASVLHFRDDTLHVFRQVIGTVAYLGIGERAVIPQGLQGALADFQLQADILVVEPASPSSSRLSNPDGDSLHPMYEPFDFHGKFLERLPFKTYGFHNNPILC